ncbi:MAG: flagellar biosynthesis anti-sigma factor FlgM [Gammaproteobacteria bacterium]|nr:flagellar biosynthesis anti-sigma factor FlgM [Gammaproteobacteria bacterium]
MDRPCWSQQGIAGDSFYGFRHQGIRLAPGLRRPHGRNRGRPVRLARRRGTPAGAAARDDTVELSGVADLIATAARKLAAEPAVDQARVQEIRKAITSGSYTVDPERIARKLIDADSQY